MPINEDIYDVYVMMLKEDADAMTWNDGEIWIEYWENGYYRTTKVYVTDQDEYGGYFYFKREHSTTAEELGY